MPKQPHFLLISENVDEDLKSSNDDYTDSDDDAPKNKDTDQRERRSYDVEATFVKEEGLKGNCQSFIMLDPEHLDDPDFGFIKDKNQGSNSYWRCRRKWKTGCRISAVTKGSVLKSITGVHLEASHKIKQCNKRLFNVEAKFIKGKEGSTILIDPDHPDDTNFVFGRSGKAHGDVVYWQCRKKPCKVTAKTNGFILESISGEHSESSHMSLNASPVRKQSYTRSKGQSMNAPAKFSRSQGGGIILTDPMGMTYNRDRQRGEVIYWRCRMSRRHGCKAYAHTNSDSVILRITQEHTHGVDPPELVGRGNWKRDGTVHKNQHSSKVFKLDTD